MNEETKPNKVIGSIVSVDLTVPDADNIRDFYKAVVGWESEGLEMEDENGKYEDYVMKNNTGSWVGGVCHKRGTNKDLPGHWIIYIGVEDVSKSIEKCLELGGKVLKVIKDENNVHHYALIQDPSGAAIALVPAS
jgi:predicted enzyme related to lactoylglutathione lyase